jgi:O-antigen/teichoic acid export membrane protein
VKFGLQTGSTILLARLLSPQDFGLQGMVVAMTGILSLFRDAGLSAATVQREAVTREQTSTLFWINALVGASLSILGVLMAPMLALFYKEPRLFWVTVVSVSGFLFNSLAVQHQALLTREFRFGTLARIDILALTVSTVIGTLLAMAGYGYWALVGMAVSGPLVTAAGSWYCMPWIPGRPKRGSGIKSMLRFGGTVTLNSLVVYLAYNTEKILLGRYWGPAALGLYGRAYQLANLPVQQLNSALGTVAFPALAQIQGNPERLKRSFLTGYALLLSLTSVVCMLCALFADEIVRILLGEKWREAAAILRLLAPAVLAFAMVNPFGWLLQATGRAVRSLNIALLIAPVVVLGVIAGLRRGPAGVALGYSVAMLLLIFPIIIWATRGTGITLNDYLKTIWRPLLSGVVAGLAGLIFKSLFAGIFGPLGFLLMGITVSLAIYGWVLLVPLGQMGIYRDVVRNALKAREG